MTTQETAAPAAAALATPVAPAVGAELRVAMESAALTCQGLDRAGLSRARSLAFGAF